MSVSRPDFRDLVELRRQWRNFHERQDRENADRVFKSAGVENVKEFELNQVPKTLRLKLNEFGRDWERILAVQGKSEGHVFYRLTLSIAVDEVKRLHDWIDKKLDGAAGAALFFESDGKNALHDGVWNAVFMFTLHSRRDPKALGIETAPGVRKIGRAEVVV